MTEFSCGGFIIRDTNQMRNEEGQTGSKKESCGQQRIYDVTDRHTHLTIAYCLWQNGEKDIRALDVQGAKAIMRLQHGGLRLGIRQWSKNKTKAWVELRQARIKPAQNMWSNLFNATWQELDAGAKIDTHKILTEAGAIQLGTKADLLEVDDNTRARLCALFPPDNTLFPIVAFVVTRVLPLQLEYPVQG